MATRRKIIILFLVSVIIIGAAGVIVWQQFYQPKKPIAGRISIMDDAGRNVTITKYPPERIVSIMPVCTEIAFALGLGSKVVGVDEHSDYPPEVQERVKTGNITNLGDPVGISIEALVALEPDLVLSDHGGVQSPIVERLEEHGLPVVVLHPKNIDGALSDILLVGEITGQMDEAKVLVNNLKIRIQEVTDKTQSLPRPRVYVEYYFNGGYWSIGSKSFINELIYMAGGINIFAGFAGEYMRTSMEEVLAANPEIIIISKGDMATKCGLTPETIKERLGWSEIDALQNNQIYEIDEDIIIRPGPRIVDGLKALAEIIHPEAFG